jgi:tetratricopeptide (TPR) repeat protein
MKTLALVFFLAVMLPGAAVAADEEVAGFVVKGNEYLKAGEGKKAIDEFNRAVEFIKGSKIEAEFPIVYFNRGRAYEKMNMTVEALGDYTHAITLDPRYVIAYYNRGVLYQKMKNLDGALADYNAMLALDPDQVHAYNNRGLVFACRGEPAKAISDFTSAIKIDPNVYNVHLNRGLAYLCQKDYTRAREDFFVEKEKYPYCIGANLLYMATNGFLERKYEVSAQMVKRLQELGYELSPGFIDDLDKALGK